MPPTTLSPRDRLKGVLASRYFWIIVAMLTAATFLHYFFAPQTRFPLLVSFPLTRQAIGRIIFILPVAGATFAFGQAGGLITLAIAVLLMLPRVFLISPYPIDAFVETMGIAVVSYLVIWMIETQEREKSLHQKAVEELETVNAIAVTVSQSLDLHEILDKALGKVLEVMGLEAKGGIFLLDAGEQKLYLRVHHGLSPEFVRQEAEIAVGECLCGVVAESGEVLFSYGSSEDVRHTRCRELDPHSHIIVPLKVRDRVLGVMFLYLQGKYQPQRTLDAADRQLFASIGSQIGVAIENARLYENMRFYIRQTAKAQEDERKRIARELHDDTTQALIDLSRRLDNLATSREQLSETAKRHFEEFQELIDSILRGVRRFSQDLRPSVLDDLGLLPALEWLTANLMEGNGIEAELKVYGDRRRMPSEAELVLFRIVQEALNNVRRHSQASRVVTVVEFGESRASPELVLSKVEGQSRRVRITVEDNGQGFELPARTGDLATTGKLGLIGMHERARLLDGTLTVRSEPGKGTTVTVDVPV
jgi:two-component system sensor histidine kinase DegS